MNNMPDKLLKQIPQFVQSSPVLILAGRDDMVIPPRWSESGANRLKDACREVVFVELNGQHCAMLRDSPKDYERTVLDFLNTHQIN